MVRPLARYPSVAYNTAGVTTVIPGGALTADDCFGVNGNPLATTSKVLAEFVKHVKLEKAESSVVPSYMPNLFSGKSPAEEAAGWVDMQCALLGAESLDHVLLCWQGPPVHADTMYAPPQLVRLKPFTASKKHAFNSAEP